MARPRSEEARSKAIAAALEVIAEAGVDGFTVDAVANRSGVAKTTIYRHFRSGDDLLMHAIDCSIEAFVTPNTGALRTDLVAIYEQAVPALADPQMFGILVGLMARAVADPEFARLKDELEQVRRQPLRTVLELAQARGEVAVGVDLDLCLELVEGCLMARRLISGSEMSVEEIPAIVDLVLGGIATRS